jgi:hypothetical protein
MALPCEGGYGAEAPCSDRTVFCHSVIPLNCLEFFRPGRAPSGEEILTIVA